MVMLKVYTVHKSRYEYSNFWWCRSRDRSIIHVLLIISTVDEFLIEQEVIKGLVRQTPTHHPGCGTPSWINEGSFRGDSLDTGRLFIGRKKSIARRKCWWCSQGVLHRHLARSTRPRGVIHLHFEPPFSFSISKQPLPEREWPSPNNDFLMSGVTQ